MLIQYFYDDALAHASYLIGCQNAGEALIVDPGRDIEKYLQAAITHNVTIVGVTETHIHADFVSGVRELAAATDAMIYLSDEGGTAWGYVYPAGSRITWLTRDTELAVGSVRLRVLHTPGHTPEHIAFLIIDSAASEDDIPFALLSGDCLFVGDVGRPDLLELAAGAADTARSGAEQQFRSLQTLRHLPDFVQVLPGHGAGSACGKALGAVPATTLGYEKYVNPALQFEEEAAFVEWLLADQPDVPHYFTRMKQVNRTGAALLLDLPQAQHIGDSPEGLVPPDALFIDTRPNADYARRHLPGTLNIPISSAQFCTYVGWFVNYDAPTFFIAYPNDVQDVLKALLKIGVDHVPGYFTPDVLDSASHTSTVPQMTPQQAAQQQLPILDVRGADEYHTAHIPHAWHVPMGQILARLSDIPADQTIAVQCGSGIRSQLVWSVLERAGFTNLVNLRGGLEAWRAAGLPVEE